MNDRTEPEHDELEQLRSEVEKLRREREFFIAEHRWGARLAALIVVGPRLTESIRRWLIRASLKDPLPIEEATGLAAAIVRRLLAVGLLGLLIPTAPLIWQNLLIRDQNQYFREQTGELRKQISVQEEQGDLVRRKDLLQAIYDGRAAGLSARVRVEALKALVALDNKLIDQGRLEGRFVNLRGVDLSCDETTPEECADLSGARLNRVDFTGSKFKGASFRNTYLRDSIFIMTDLSSADLSRAVIKGTKFREDTAYPLRTTREYIDSLNEIGESLDLMEADYLLKKKYSERLADRYDLLEFASGRIRISIQSKTELNRNLRAASFNARTIFMDHQDYFTSEDFFIDGNTLLPIGAEKPQRIKTFIERLEQLERVQRIQEEVDNLFGRYRFNVFSTVFVQPPRTFIKCLDGPLEGRFEIERAFNLAHLESLTARARTAVLEEACKADVSR